MKFAEQITTSPRAEIISYKSLGYSFKTALADIIDNSISANATEIKIFTDFDSDSPVLMILDNGIGMDLKSLIVAMKPGGKDPTQDREKNDLGRFGLGLKSASFSQCNSLKVVSRKSGYTSVTRTWDLNYVVKYDKWQLFEEEISKEETNLIGEQGTLVIWKNFDQIVNDNNSSVLKSMLHEAYEYCRLVFHRFVTKGKIKILFNGNRVSAFDPFFYENSNVMHLPVENKGYGVIKAHILPIPSKNMTKEEESNYSLINGFNLSQGVYIYREDRLIAHGGWFDIVKSNELNKLARISIDYTNDLDSIWSLDVVKSQAIPPKGSRKFFKKVFENAINESKAAFKEKGKRIRKANPFKKEKPDELWLDKLDKESEKHSYSINIQNAYIKFYCEHYGIDKSKLNPLLKIIGDLLPLEQIIENNSENPNSHVRDGFPENHQLLGHAKSFMKALVNTGMTEGEAKNEMANRAPFKQYPEILLAI